MALAVGGFLVQWYSVGLDQRNYSTPGPVSTGMGDRVRDSTPGAGKLVDKQPPRSTQPGHLFVDRRYVKAMGGDALRL